MQQKDVCLARWGFLLWKWYPSG